RTPAAVVPHPRPSRLGRGGALPTGGSPDRPAAATAPRDRPRPSAPFAAGKGPDPPSAPSPETSPTATLRNAESPSLRAINASCAPDAHEAYRTYEGTKLAADLRRCSV